MLNTTALTRRGFLKTLSALGLVAVAPPVSTQDAPSQDSPYFETDSLHPTKEAYERIASIVAFPFPKDSLDKTL